MDPNLTSPFLREGILGVIIIVLATVCVILYKKIDKQDEIIRNLQDKRVEDANAFTSSFTSVAREMVGNQKDLLNQNQILHEAVKTLTQAVQSIFKKGS